MHERMPGTNHLGTVLDKASNTKHAPREGGVGRNPNAERSHSAAGAAEPLTSGLAAERQRAAGPPSGYSRRGDRSSRRCFRTVHGFPGTRLLSDTPLGMGTRVGL